MNQRLCISLGMEMILKSLTEVDFIASLASHIPNKNEQMVRYMYVVAEGKKTVPANLTFS
ncbi:MAG: hypothetical protein ACYDIA_19545 [Candidatus Humimicrobiaceae bacterium]